MSPRTDIPQLLGYQVANARGFNIQGDEADPSGLESYEVMEAELADHFMATHPGFLLMPIYSGMVEGEVVVGMGHIGTEWEDRAKANHERFAAPRATPLTPKDIAEFICMLIDTHTRSLDEDAAPGHPDHVPHICTLEGLMDGTGADIEFASPTDDGEILLSMKGDTGSFDITITRRD